MATFHLVGSGNWQDPSIWSLSFNGTGGAGVPGSGDLVNINTNNTVTVGEGNWTDPVQRITHTNGTLKLGGGNLFISGDYYFSAGDAPRTLDLDTGTMQVDGVGFYLQGSNLNFIPGTSKITLAQSFSASSSLFTFDTGNETFADVYISMIPWDASVFRITSAGQNTRFRTLDIYSSGSTNNRVEITRNIRVDKLIAVSDSASNPLTLCSQVVGTQDSLSYIDLQGSATTSYGRNVRTGFAYYDQNDGTTVRYARILPANNAYPYIGQTSFNNGSSGWLYEDPRDISELIDDTWTDVGSLWTASASLGGTWGPAVAGSNRLLSLRTSATINSGVVVRSRDSYNLRDQTLYVRVYQSGMQGSQLNAALAIVPIFEEGKSSTGIGVGIPSTGSIVDYRFRSDADAWMVYVERRDGNEWVELSSTQIPSSQLQSVKLSMQAVAGDTTAPVLYIDSVGVEPPPNTPPVVTLNEPLDGSSLVSDTPTLSFTGVDPEREPIDYNLQVSENSDFSSPHTNVSISGRPSSLETSYTLQTPLTKGGVTYHWRVRGRDPSGSDTWGEWSSRTMVTETIPATLTTSSATNITYTSATLGGNVTSTGGTTVTERGVVYSTSQNPTTSSSRVTSGSGTGSFTVNVTDLTAETTYYVRAYAINSEGTSYGPQVSFATTTPTPPSITTGSVSDITYTTATVAGNVTNANGAAVTERGVVYSTSQNPTTANSKSTAGSGTGTFTTDLTGLTTGSNYYVRAYAINAKGTSYGSQVAFSTGAVTAPTLTSSNADSITINSARLHGNVTSTNGGNVTQRGFVYGLSANPTTSDNVVTATGTTGTFNAVVTGLDDSTTYHWRAFATNSGGTGYSTSRSFATTTVLIPSVTTSPVSNVTLNSATTGGNVTSANNGTITERGVVYSTSANPTTSNTKVTATGTTGSFTSNLSGLSSGTTYYVRAYAINQKGTAYGSQQTFTTQSVTPTINTGTAQNITLSGFTIQGSGVLTNPDSVPLTEFGVSYTLADETAPSVRVSGTGTPTSWSTTISDLDEGTRYLVRSYAVWGDNQTVYGPEVTVSTHGRPVVTLNTPDDTQLHPLTGMLKFTGVDPDGDDISYQLQIRFVEPDPFVDVYSSTDVGFTSSTTDPFESGDEVNYDQLSGLVRGITYYWRVRGRDVNGSNQWGDWTSEGSFVIAPLPPALTTGNATSINYTSATVSGEITDTSGKLITERGVVYSTSQNPTTADSKVTSSGGSSFDVNITGLSDSTTYYARAYAINSVGTGYGNQVTFTTTVPTPPTVSTGSASNITYTTATVAGNVTNANGANVTERGVVYSTSTNPTTSSTKVISGSGTGSFNANITGLTAQTSYYARAYAINSKGTSYGSQITFSTTNITPPTVSSSVADTITIESARLYGNVTNVNGGTISERGFVYGLSANPTTSNSKRIVAGTTGAYDAIVSPLDDGTTYHWRAYAINSGGTGYSTSRSFTTVAVSVPSMVTFAVSAITINSATVAGSLSSSNNGTTSEVGIVYSTTQNPTVADNKIENPSVTSNYSIPISGLESNTTYYVRAYGINQKGAGYGTQRSFTTLPQAPTVTTGSVTAHSGFSSVTVSGNSVATNPDNQTIEEFGIVYATSQNPTTANSTAIGSGSASSWSANATGLTEGGTYYVRAYIKWNNGVVVYGQQITLTTQTRPVVVLHLPAAAATVEPQRPDFEFTGTDLEGGVLEYQIQVSSSSNFANTAIDDTSSSTPAGSNVGFFKVDGGGRGPFDSAERVRYAPNTNLVRGVTYYWRVRSRDVDGSNLWGNWSSSRSVSIDSALPSNFSNPVAPHPTASYRTATLGRVTAQSNGATITEIGFVYSTSPNPTTEDIKVVQQASGNVNIANLTEGTHYYVRPYAINAKGTAYGDQSLWSFTTVATTAPTVTTASVTNINYTSAIAGGVVTDDNGEAVTERGIVYSTSQNPTTTSTKVISGSGLGSFSAALSNLVAQTTYYVRAYAINTKGTSYGSQVSFSTTDVTPPTVTSQAADTIQTTSARLYGNVTNINGGVVTERGFVYSTSQNPTTADSKKITPGETGAYSDFITGLSDNTTYYWRAYAINSGGTGYSSQLSFTTVEILVPTATTASVSNITQTTAVSGGNVTSAGNGNITERGIVYGTSPNPTTANTKITSTGTTGSFVSNLSGLSSNTTYYIRAYGINERGTGYGNQQTFTTSPIPPTVSTGSASGLSLDSFTVSGNSVATNPDNQIIEEFGVVYSTSQNPTLSNGIQTGSGTPSAWSASITGLNENTTYYVRAYIKWAGDNVIYGNQISYRTQGRPVVTLNYPSDAGYDGSTQPELQFTGTDVDDSTISYQLQLHTSSTMTSPMVDVLSANDVGFENISSSKGDPFYSGDTIQYTLQQHLVRSQTYYWRVRGRDVNGSNQWGFWSSRYSFTVESTAPTVVTGTASGVSYTGAVVSGEVTNAQGSAVTERGIVYSTSPNPTTSNVKVMSGSGVGSFSANLTTLSDNTTYYARAYAINSRGTSYGSQVAFTTIEITAPSVTTSTPTNISYTSATTGGNVTDTNGSSVTERGIVYSTTQNPTIYDNRELSGSGTGSYTVNLSDLTDGTTYYIRAYAINSRGVAYGSQATLSTVPITSPTVTSSTADSIQTTSARVYGNVTASNGSTVTERGFVYATGTNPTTADTKRVISGGVGTFDAVLSGLTDGTQYHWRAYAINARGTAYSQDRSFTTLGVNVPTVSTSAISNITLNSAVTGGNVTAANNGTITERGVVYSTSPTPTVLDTKVVSGGTVGSFISNLTGLSTNTTYYVRAYATNERGVGYGAQRTFTTEPVVPTVVTGVVSGTAIDSLTITNSRVSMNTDNQSIEEFGVVYSTSSNPTVADDLEPGVGTPDGWNTTLTGLEEDQTYYVRAYIRWRGSDYTYGPQATRKTQGRPVVTLNSPADSDDTQVNPPLEFTGVDPDNDNITYQIEVSTNPQFNLPQISVYSSGDPGFTTVSGSGVDPFNSASRIRFTPTTLWRGQNFHWRVRGRDVNGSDTWGEWSDTHRFWVLPILPSVSISSIDNILFATADVSAEVSQDGGATVTERGAVYSTSQNPTVEDNKVSAGSGTGAFTANLINLEGSTRYFVRAYAITSAGVGYSAQTEFNTLQTPNPPTVTTGTATNLTESTAEVKGNEVVLDGTEPVTERGVVFSTSPNPDIDNRKIIAATVSVGIYDIGVTGLEPETLHYARAYAMNSIGVGYGEEITFTTEAPFEPDEGDGYWTWTPDRSSAIIGRSQPTPPNSSVDLYLSDLNLEDGLDYTLYYRDATSIEGETSVVLQWVEGGIQQQYVVPAGQPYTFTYDESHLNWAVRLFVTGDELETEQINASFSDLYLAQESEFSGFTPFIAKGATEIKLENNWLLDKRREDTIQNIFTVIEGESWYPFKANTIGLGWYEIGDRVTIEDLDGTRDVVIWDTSLTIDGGIKDSLSATTPDKAETDYKKAGSVSSSLKRTQISVDHNEQQILSLVEDIHDVDGVINTKFSEIEQTVGSIASTVQSSGGVNLIKNSVMFDHEESNQAERDNLALNKPVSGSFEPAVGTFSLATDGDTSTMAYVSSSTGSQYIEVDLGEVYELNEVRVWHYYSDDRTYNNPKTEVSEDGDTWIVVAEPASYQETSSGSSRQFPPIRARYVRDYINGSSANSGNHWVEIEVYATPQYVQNWEIEGGGSLVIQASPESMSAGGISGNAFTLSNMLARQIIPVRADRDDIPDESKLYYALSARVKKNIVGSAWIRVSNTYESHEIELPDQTGYTWDDVSLESLLPVGDHYVLEIWSDDDADLQVTDLMLSPGENTRQWTQSNGEVMNTSVALNDDSITVRSNIYRNDFVRITALGFEVHSRDASGDRIFGFNGDETNVYKFKADEQISMGPVRAVPIEYGNYKGWAFTRTEEQ